MLIYASAPPAEVEAAQARLGRDRAGGLVEQAMAAIATGLVAAGARRLVVAGGETSGAVVGALGVKGLRIGPMIDPGVPATVSLGGERPLALALKSGNFGGPDFLTRAFTVMPGGGSLSCARAPPRGEPADNPRRSGWSGRARPNGRGRDRSGRTRSAASARAGGSSGAGPVWCRRPRRSGSSRYRLRAFCV